jgi:hypothetical protein
METGGLLELGPGLTHSRTRSDAPGVLMRKWLRDGLVFAIYTGGRTWLPAYQVNRSSHTARQDVRSVANELRPAFDAWALCWWFLIPDLSLGGLAPIEAMDTGFEHVLELARRDRFAIAG